MKRLWGLVGLVLLTFSGAAVTLAQGATPGFTAGSLVGVTVFPGIGTFVGHSGTYEGHVVIEPIEATAPEGLKEDSWFNVTGFHGSVCLATTPPLCAVTFSPVDAWISVHFGDEPNKPVATVLVTSGDLRLILPWGVSDPLKLMKIVGGEVVQLRFQ